MSSDSVISAVSATSRQSLVSAADVDRKKKKNKNWVRNDNFLAVVFQLICNFLGLRVDLVPIVCFR